MISLEAIMQAAAVITPHIIRTPMVFSPTISNLYGGAIHLKLENLQRTGSFKVRGATYKILAHRQHIGGKGVVTASAGNHAQGVALAAHNAGLPATIIMPEWASITKQEASRGYGGDVRIKGNSIAEAIQYAKRLAENGQLFIPPFDDFDIMTGQGTIGLEIMQELPQADIVIVPVGGGGLIAGIASAVKRMRPQCKVIGVEASVCPSAYESLRQNKVISVGARPSIADGISVKKIGKRNFEMIRECVDDIVLVDEEQIAAAVLMLLERKKVLAEGAGAVPLAALMSGRITLPANAHGVLVVSGGNVDNPLLGRIIDRGLIDNGRILRLRIPLEDTSGSLARLLTLVASLKANVLHIYHDRHMRHLPLDITYVELELETRGFSHCMEIADAIRNAGYAIEHQEPSHTDTPAAQPD